MAEDGQLEFSERAIRDFLVKNGGKVKNEELVKTFKPYLSDPDNKARNREKFKEYVNRIATIKTEEGDKYLVLKKKYREPALRELTEPDGGHDKENQNQEITTEDVMEEEMQPEDEPEQSDVKKRVLDVAQSFEKKAEEEKAQAEAAWVSPTKIQREEDGNDDESVSSTVTVVTDDIDRISDVVGDNSESSRPAGSSGAVDEKAHHFANIELNETEKKWMFESAEGNTTMLASLLVNEPNLYKQKDFTNTALHWAAKHGKKEMVKLLAGRRELDINARSHGGYTPLHIAAIHGHDSVIQMLVSDFKADVNVRDYNGKKAKHHLKKGAPNHIQQMLQGNVRVYSVKRRTQRSNSIEKKRSSVPFFNKPLKWGSAENLSQSKKEKTPPATPPSSPALRRQNSSDAIDKELMPPPKAPGRKSRKKKTESLHGSRESHSEDPRRSQSEPDLLAD